MRKPRTRDGFPLTAMVFLSKAETAFNRSVPRLRCRAYRSHKYSSAGKSR
jgi:hypothetical protein